MAGKYLIYIIVFKVANLEEENQRLMNERQSEMAIVNRQTSASTPVPSNHLTQEHIMQEIFTTMNQRKKLHSHMSRLESELSNLQQKPVPTVPSSHVNNVRNFLYNLIRFL